MKKYITITIGIVVFTLVIINYEYLEMIIKIIREKKHKEKNVVYHCIPCQDE